MGVKLLNLLPERKIEIKILNPFKMTPYLFSKEFLIVFYDLNSQMESFAIQCHGINNYCICTQFSFSNRNRKLIKEGK